MKRFFRVEHFRAYPWAMQLLLFLLTIITMIGVGRYATLYYVAKFTNYTLEQLVSFNSSSPLDLIHTSLVTNGILTSIFIFLLPAVLFAYFASPRPAEYLGLRAPGKWIQLLLVLMVMLGAMPVLQMIETLMGLINFSPAIKADQAASEKTMYAYLSMHTFGDFVRCFLFIAILPACGEELFFRGVLLRFARKRSRNMVLPVLFTAAVFAYAHANIYGLPSIFLAGILLAVIYNLTGSLWCSIAAHMFFNGFQIFTTYFGNSTVAASPATQSMSASVLFVIGGAILFAVSFYLLLKNKTPLPDNWAEDFTAAELLAKAD